MKRLTDEVLDGIWSDYKAGMAVRNVARKYGVSMSTVTRHTVKLRMNGKLWEKREQMQAERDAGIPVKKIAKKYGLAESSILAYTRNPVCGEVNKDQIRAMQDARDHGDSLEEIAKEYGVSCEMAMAYTHRPKTIKFQSSGIVRERREYKNPITPEEIAAKRASLRIGARMEIPVMQYDETGIQLGRKKELCQVEHVSRHVVVFRRPNGRPEHRTVVELCRMGRKENDR